MSRALLTTPPNQEEDEKDAPHDHVHNAETVLKVRMFDRSYYYLKQMKVTITNLGLQLIADGVVADLVALSQVKFSIVRLIGFRTVSFVPNGSTYRVDFDDIKEISPSSYTCFYSLMRALDTSVQCELPPGCMRDDPDTTIVPGTLGSLFVDIILKITEAVDISMLPYLVSRSILESLVIIILKASFPKRHLHGLTPL